MKISKRETRSFITRTLRTGAAVGVTLALLTFALGPAPAAAAPQDHQMHMHHGAMKPTPDQEVDGLSIPDVQVKDQFGKDVSFYSDLVKGKVVAMNFVFTTCTTICPPMGANFGKLQKILGDKMGKDFHLISVSVDPVTDTPERMHAWGAKFGTDKGWTLVTGDKDKVTTLLKSLEVFNADITEHSPVVLIGNDTTGKWTRAYGLAPPNKLAELLEKMKDGDSGQGGGAK